ncbi:ABC transporter permease [Clostridia bacterium]|nr:ABC transporter permease [Clostridia bacterium]
MNAKNDNLVKRIFAADQFALVLALIVIFVFFSAATEYFLTGQNISNIFRQVSINLVAGVGMTVLLLIGDVDLSIGSLVALVGVACVATTNATQSVFVGIVVGIAVGVGVGFVNGKIVTGFGINSLIATLGMMSVIRGAVYIITNAVAVQVTVPTFTLIGSGNVFGVIPIPIVISLGLFIVFFIVLRYTAFGRYIYAAGDNPEAAKASGLNVNKLKMYTFIICSTLAAVAGLILTARTNSAQPNSGSGLEFTVIAAVILGGTSLSGGKGSLIGSLIGVFILQLVNTGLVMMNVSSFWQEVVRGSVIILAVVLDTARQRKQEIASSKLTQQLALENASKETT